MVHSDEAQTELSNREFVRLLALHERQLSGYVHIMVPMWQDAEDILQNTKLRLWEQFGDFRRDADFGAWAIAIAHCMIQTHRTNCRRQRVCFNDKLLEKISQYIPIVSSSLQDDRASALADCVKTLNEAGRHLLHLFCTGQRKIKDIAREVGLSPAAAYTNLFRIRKSLFECVQRRLQERDVR